jgi:hypothetical protein
MSSMLFFRNSTTAFFHAVGLLGLISWSTAADRSPAEKRVWLLLAKGDSLKSTQVRQRKNW